MVPYECPEHQQNFGYILLSFSGSMVPAQSMMPVSETSIAAAQNVDSDYFYESSRTAISSPSLPLLCIRSHGDSRKNQGTIGLYSAFRYMLTRFFFDFIRRQEFAIYE